MFPSGYKLSKLRCLTVSVGLVKWVDPRTVNPKVHYPNDSSLLQFVKRASVVCLPDYVVGEADSPKIKGFFTKHGCLLLGESVTPELKALVTSPPLFKRPGEN
jgi:hypothetical protein